jgi:hypothetical protein
VTSETPGSLTFGELLAVLSDWHGRPVDVYIGAPGHERALQTCYLQGALTSEGLGDRRAHDHLRVIGLDGGDTIIALQTDLFESARWGCGESLIIVHDNVQVEIAPC